MSGEEWVCRGKGKRRRWQRKSRDRGIYWGRKERSGFRERMEKEGCRIERGYWGRGLVGKGQRRYIYRRREGTLWRVLRAKGGVEKHRERSEGRRGWIVEGGTQREKKMDGGEGGGIGGRELE
jgi:hypothetical protein